MEINITFIVQIIIFIFYLIFCKKYIWPYLNKKINKRKENILSEYNKIKKIKRIILILKNRINKIIDKNKKISSFIILEANKKSKSIIDNTKKKAFKKYKKILSNNRIKIKNEKKIMYNDFYKNINYILNNMLIKITKNNFNKKLNNDYINELLKKYKI